MKIVFLDFDGVLNSSDFLYRDGVPFSSTSADEKIDPEAVRRLNSITDTTGACIVVTSAWRIGKRVADLRGLLTRHGVTGTVIGATSTKGYTRGAQIADWIQSNSWRGPVEKFVILDDDGDMGPLSDHLVKTTSAHGLLDEHIPPSITLLGYPDHWFEDWALGSLSLTEPGARKATELGFSVVRNPLGNLQIGEK